MNRGFLPGLKPPPTIPPWMMPESPLDPALGGGHDGLVPIFSSRAEGKVRLAQLFGPCVLMSDFESGSFTSDADFDNALGAALSVAQTRGFCRLFLDSRDHYRLGRTPVSNGNGHGSYAQVPLPWVSAGDDTASHPATQPWCWIEIVGMAAGSMSWSDMGIGSAAGAWTPNYGTVVENVLPVASIPPFSGTTGVCSMFGGPSSFAGLRSGQNRSGVGVSWRNVTLLQPNNPGMCGVDMGWHVMGAFPSLRVTTPQFNDGTPIANFVGASMTNGYQGVGIIFPFVNMNPPMQGSYVSVEGYGCGVIFGELADIDILNCQWCYLAFGLDSAYHPNDVNQLIDTNNVYGFAGWDCATPVISPTSTGSASGVNSSWAASPVRFRRWNLQLNNGQTSGFNRVHDIHDGNGAMELEGEVSIVKAAAGVVRAAAGSPPTLTNFAILGSGSSLTGGTVTRVRDFNASVGPRPVPAFPTSGTAIRNPFLRDCLVTIAGGTVTAVSIGGSPSVPQGDGTFLVPATLTISVTYTGSPTWTWIST